MAQDAPLRPRSHLQIVPAENFNFYWFIDVLNAKDLATGQHSVRVFEILNEWMTARQKEGLVTAQQVADWSLAALLHDVGKLAVSDAVLSKGDILDVLERAEMERHVELGYELIRDLPNSQSIADLVRAHHERWDGQGYPFRLKADRIPEGARVIAIADTFDAMTGFRPYRNPLTEAEALQEIERCAGTQFCPRWSVDFIRFRRAQRQ